MADHTSSTQIDLSVPQIDHARKAFRARIRFRAMVRLAYANREWLQEKDPIKKKRDRSVHSREPAAQNISLADKAILNRNSIYRTDENKERIYKIISFLKSFRKYKENIVRQLACVTYYAYFETNRIIVRQNQPGHAMYFLLKGECEAYSSKYDKRLQEDVETSRSTLVSGTTFGDYALLHKVPHAFTITTTTSCEFLYLKADDFDEILRDLIADDWQETMDYMSKFTYFNDWDIKTKRECCMIAKRVHYRCDETVLGKSEKEADLPMVHFIISGECVMIEFLLVHENIINGVLKRRLFSTKEEDELYRHPASSSTTNTLSATLLTPSRMMLRSGNGSDRAKSLTRIVKRMEQIQQDVDVESNEEDEDEVKEKVRHKERLVEISKPKDLKTYFIQICTHSELGCFNLGENLRRRCIVAKRDMVCLVIPRYWLMAEGWSNRWNMIKNFLNRQIPTTEQIYREFLEKRKFNQYKKDFVSNLRHSINCNCIGNVPYSIRMVHDFEFEETPN